MPIRCSRRKTPPVGGRYWSCAPPLRRQPPALSLRPLGAPRLPAPDDALARGRPRDARAAARRRHARRPHPPQGRRARGGVPRAARARGPLDRPHPDLRRRGLRRRRARGGSPRRRCAPARRMSSTSRTSQRDGRWRGFADFLERRRTARTSRSTRSSRGRRSRRTFCSSASTPSSSGGSRARPSSASTSSSAAASGRRSASPSSTAYFRRARERFLGVARAGRRDVPVAVRPLRDLRLPQPLRAAARGRRQSRARRRAATRLGGEAHGGRRRDARPAGLAPRDGQRRLARHPARELERIRHQAELQLHFRETGSTSTSSWPTRRSAASASCPSRTSATSGSTSRGIRSTSRRAGSSTCSAGATATRTARCATRRSGRATATASARASSGSSTGSSSAAAATRGSHVYHYAAYERTALAGSWASTGRASTRSTTSCARRCSSTSTASSSRRSARRRRATRSRRSRRCTGSCARPRSWAATSRRPLREVARDRRRLAAAGHRALQRGGLPLDGRAARVAALDPAGRSPVAPPARRAAAERGGDARDEERAALRDRLLAGTEEGDAAAAPRAAPRLPPARGEAAVVGVVPLAAARRGRAHRGPHTIGGLAVGRASRRRSRARATRTDDLPRAGAQDLGRGVRPGDATTVPHAGRRRHGRRRGAARDRQGRRAAAARPDPGAPDRRRRQARRADAFRACVRGRDETPIRR